MQLKKPLLAFFSILIVQLSSIYASSFQDRDIGGYPCYHKHGVRVPKPGSCSEYYVCVNSNAIASTCSGAYHFDEVTRRCVPPENAVCHEVLPTPAPSVENVSPLSFPAHIPKPHHPDEVVPDKSAGNICRHQINGALVPKPDSCNHYYVCLLKEPYRRTCPILLHFNAERGVCQDPALAGCMAPPKLPTPGNSLKALELAAFSHDGNTCSGMPDGILLPHTDSCNKFYNCRNQERIEMSCPQGLHFNMRQQNCDWPSAAKCTL